MVDAEHFGEHAGDVKTEASRLPKLFLLLDTDEAAELMPSPAARRSLLLRLTALCTTAFS